MQHYDEYEKSKMHPMKPVTKSSTTSTRKKVDLLVVSAKKVSFCTAVGITAVAIDSQFSG